MENCKTKVKLSSQGSHYPAIPHFSKSIQNSSSHGSPFLHECSILETHVAYTVFSSFPLYPIGVVDPSKWMGRNEKGSEKKSSVILGTVNMAEMLSVLLLSNRVCARFKCKWFAGDLDELPGECLKISGRLSIDHLAGGL